LFIFVGTDWKKRRINGFINIYDSIFTSWLTSIRYATIFSTLTALMPIPPMNAININ